MLEGTRTCNIKSYNVYKKNKLWKRLLYVGLRLRSFAKSEDGKRIEYSKWSNVKKVKIKK